MFFFSAAILLGYLSFKRYATGLSFWQLAMFMALGIINLCLFTRFITHYIILPSITHIVPENITANWADAIRYSRYPATMILSVFGVFVWITWIVVASDLKNYLSRIIVVLMITPLICALVGYSTSAIYTFKGTSPLFTEEHRKYSSVISSAYWMVGEYFLIISLVDVFFITIYFFNYIIK